MKQYQSTVEGLWFEIKPVQLTEEQKALMLSQRPEDREAQITLRDEIKAQREVAVSKTVKAELDAFYESKKPVLKDGETYQLIAVNMSGEQKSYRGIINCRVNGEHIQIRF
jgi:hypothetical protein